MALAIQLLEKAPSLAVIVAQIEKVWPEHVMFLETRFKDPNDPTRALVEVISGLILKLVGDDLATYCADYRWMCKNFIAEDLYFRRHGSYRRSTFEEAFREVYDKPEYMERYVHGILMSQILWSNQTAAFDFYVEQFLNNLSPSADFLEIGPGHGLLLYFAARRSGIASIAGWDVSDTSIQATAAALKRMQVTRPVKLRNVNILEPIGGEDRFDGVVISEVLEHLDKPEVALDTIFSICRPGGKVFINVPCNSPAPDHIFLWRAPEEVEDLVKSCGFDIVTRAVAPTTGYTEEQARKRRVTLNSMIVAQRPA